MAHDQLESEGQTTRRAGGGRFIVAGVVGACVLGVGLGLWARPSSAERGDAPPPPKPELEARLSDRRLQIVLDDSPAPIGQPLEVMPADTPGLLTAPAGPQPPTAEPSLPKGPPLGLMKVDAPIAAAPAVIPAIGAEPRPAPKPEPKAERSELGKAKVEKPKVVRAEKPQPEPTKVRKVAAKAETRKLDSKKVAAKKVAAKTATAEPKARKKEPAKALAKAEGPEKKKSQAAERKKDRPVKLAEAEAAPKKAKGEKPQKLTKLVKAVKSAPKKLKATATATAERKKKRDLELAEARETGRAKATAKAKAPVEKASAPKKKPAPRGEGPMRVARNDGCVSADPGETLVCVDPRLNQRDRQLQRAFRDAEAAGVPASALRQQQERWRQARAAAARDGSWAVEDVYEARIAELNDLARDARDF